MNTNAVSDDVLNRIPITRWVNGTVEKILGTGTHDAVTWNKCWYETYTQLGGTSKTSGTKPCPRAAARGLWILGRLRRGGRPLQTRSVVEVYRELSKNAAYAVIAADLLAGDASRSSSALWRSVQSEFTRLTGDIPAESEQGEVRLVIALFRQQELLASLTK